MAEELPHCSSSLSSPSGPSHTDPVALPAVHSTIAVPSVRGPETKTQPRNECPGFRLDLPNDQSPLLLYPFALHAVRALSYTLSIINNVVILRSKDCAKAASNRSLDTPQPCTFCRLLRYEATIMGIRYRAQDGAHEKTPHHYLSIGQLISKLNRQSHQISQLRLKGLNEGRKLTVRVRHLEASKRLILAISDVRIPRIHAVLSVARNNGSGIFTMLDMVDKAARHVYKARMYDEQDFQRTFLLWKLGGVAAAKIAYNTLGVPSIDAARRRIMTHPLRASAGMPTLNEALENLKTALEICSSSQDDVILPVSMPIDEMKTQERFRWDASRNIILGICREHGKDCCMEFRTMVQANDLLTRLQKGDVHFASEVRARCLGPRSDSNLFIGYCYCCVGPDRQSQSILCPPFHHIRYMQARDSF